MLLRLIRKHVRNQDWLAVAIDLAVVIVGILLAFQIDTWHDDLENLRLERTYLQRLRSDLEAERAQFGEIVERTELRLAQVAVLEDAVMRPEVVAATPVDFIRAIEQVTWRSFPVITAYTYNELIGSGQMMVVRSEELRRDLAEYYTLIEDTRRLGLGENDQEMFRNKTVGLLTSIHLSAIEDPERYELIVSSEEAVAVAKRLRMRGDAHGWLARLAK